MTQTDRLDARIASAIVRLRTSLDAREAAAAPDPEAETLRTRIATLEAENAALDEELERLRAKRDKDVAALDELLAQLKPLIEEV